jgi:hypothetical protein
VILSRPLSFTTSLQAIFTWKMFRRFNFKRNKKQEGRGEKEKRKLISDNPLTIQAEVFEMYLKSVQIRNRQEKSSWSHNQTEPRQNTEIPG